MQKLLYILLLISVFSHNTLRAESDDPSTNKAQHKTKKSCVVLLHGLARSDRSMQELEKALSKSNFFVVNQAYESRKHEIEILAKRTVPEALAKCEKQGKPPAIHFVTHSMGGIIIRQYLSQHAIINIGRVVMLGPPNQGSEVVDKLKKVPGFKAINGPAGLQLGTGKSSVPNKLGPVDFELGVIAGTKSINLILSTLIPEIDDGKVSVERTKVAGMNDHLTLPVTHTFMMNNKRVIEQVRHFLQTGQFFRNQAHKEDQIKNNPE